MSKAAPQLPISKEDEAKFQSFPEILRWAQDYWNDLKARGEKEVYGSTLRRVAALLKAENTDPHKVESVKSVYIHHIPFEPYSQFRRRLREHHIRTTAVYSIEWFHDTVELLVGDGEYYRLVLTLIDDMHLTVTGHFNPLSIRYLDDRRWGKTVAERCHRIGEMVKSKRRNVLEHCKPPAKTYAQQLYDQILEQIERVNKDMQTRKPTSMRRKSIS